MTLWHRAFACEWNDINGIAIEPASPTLFSWKNGNQNSATLFTHLPVPQKNSLLGMFAEQTALRAWVFSNDEICLLFHACEVVAFDDLMLQRNAISKGKTHSFPVLHWKKVASIALNNLKNVSLLTLFLFVCVFFYSQYSHFQYSVHLGSFHVFGTNMCYFCCEQHRNSWMNNSVSILDVWPSTKKAAIIINRNFQCIVLPACLFAWHGILIAAICGPKLYSAISEAAMKRYMQFHFTFTLCTSLSGTHNQ